MSIVTQAMAGFLVQDSDEAWPKAPVRRELNSLSRRKGPLLVVAAVSRARLMLGSRRL